MTSYLATPVLLLALGVLVLALWWAASSLYVIVRGVGRVGPESDYGDLGLSVGGCRSWLDGDDR